MARKTPGPAALVLHESVTGAPAFNSGAKTAAPETHVRSWFPESLFVRPEIITDKDGRASITIPIADNITTWRMAMLASTKQGALGSGSASLKVFQDFFTEMDLPVTLTQGDEVSIPVAVYNYSGSHGDVRLRLETPTGFRWRAMLRTKTSPWNRARGRLAVQHFGKAHREVPSDPEGGDDWRHETSGHRGRARSK